MKTILIVDDHEMIRANIAEFLAYHFNEATVIEALTSLIPHFFTSGFT